MGLTLHASGANIAVYAKHATKILLCLFDATGAETFRGALPHREGDVYFGFVTNLKDGQHYGLRAEGPWQPELGNCYDPSKLLLDPYATVISHGFAYHPELSIPGRETAHLVPKAVATDDAAPLPLRQPTEPTLIYEVNVRAFSMLNPAIAEEKRGTVAALAEPASIKHFKKLGVNTVELMPVAAWIDERHLVALGLHNGWGYNPVSFFAIEPKLAPGGMQEMRDTVTKLHSENINVILDVVFNHSGEGDIHGPNLSFRGLDNVAYYARNSGGYINDTGCGNTFALDRPHTVKLVVDALRHWVVFCGIDGFRFDLATIMGRTANGFSSTAPLLSAIENDPLLSSRILIAEPWDIGPGGYQLGRFPKNWHEWNDAYRDDVRRFWRSDAYAANAFATRITGSSDLFTAKGRPSRSINFIAAHDGFSLHDLLHFSNKDNLANGENNRDGKSDEVTCNATTASALLATLLFSRGTPMLMAGDEFGRSQNGNNNAYAQDNALTWLDWSKADTALVEQFAELSRQRLEVSEFFGDHFLKGTAQEASHLPDAAWFGEDGKPMNWSRPDNRVIALVLAHNNKRICIFFNGTPQPHPMKVVSRKGYVWINQGASGSSNVPAQSVTMFNETQNI